MIYKQHDAQCSGPQLVLLLCDGTIRYARDAADHLRNERWAEKGTAVEAAFDCISELRKIIDFQKGGDVANTLDRNYDLLATKLSLANTERKPEQFEQVASAMETIRNSWNDLFQRLTKEGILQEKDIKPKVLDPVS
jgi:flagellar protein FliS